MERHLDADLDKIRQEILRKVIVTHNMQQASRISDSTAFIYLGDLIEYGVTDEWFIRPQKQATEDYITRRFG